MAKMLECPDALTLGLARGADLQAAAAELDTAARAPRAREMGRWGG